MAAPQGREPYQNGTAVELSTDRKTVKSTRCSAGCWAGCWPRWSVHQGQAPASASNAIAAASEAATDDRQVVLNVGFAHARLERLEDGAASPKHTDVVFPSHAFYIEALGDTSKVDQAGFDALLDFMDHILRLPEIRRGFVLVYDLRRVGCAQLDLISQISSWVSDSQRQASWSKLCHRWYVLYPPDVENDDVNFQVTKTWLWMIFFSHPPGAPAYIIADPKSIGKKLNEDNMCFMPEQDNGHNGHTPYEMAKSVMGLGTAVLSQTSVVIDTAVTGVSSAAGAVVGVVRGSENGVDSGQTPPAAQGASVHDARAAGSEHHGGGAALSKPVPDARSASAVSARGSDKAEARSTKPGPKEVAEKFPLPLPDSINVSCAHIHQGVDAKTGLGYLKVIGTGGDITDEGLSRMMDFYDAFLYSPNAVNGFSITYDLRNLRSPSMSMILRLAEWGNEPTRQAMWQTLNVECRVCISPGMRYTISKAALSAFFYVCPPVCRTYLLTAPDDILEGAVVFMPSSPAETAPEDTPRRSPEDLQAAFKQKMSSEITDEVGKMKADDAKQPSFQSDVMSVFEEIMYGDVKRQVTPTNKDPHAWVFTTHNW